jgi:hypothetical protein
MIRSRLSPVERSVLATRVWRSYVRVRRSLHRRPLPELVALLGTRSRGPAAGIPPERLGRAVQKALTIGGRPPRCLIASLVLYDLLRGENERAEIVIGLPATPTTKDAHAWVEIDGVDVGPPPGRGTHHELARYGS